MTTIKVITYNVRGVNTPSKRCKDLLLLGANVVCLQEMHITHASGQGLESHSFPMWLYEDSTSSHSRGVAIGLDKTTVFTVREQLADPEGRFIFVKGTLFNMECTLVNIYSPNRDPDLFLKKVKKTLKYLKKGNLYWRGI